MTDVLRIQLEQPLVADFGVYARLPEGDVNLKEFGLAWVREFVAESIRGLLVGYIESPAVMVMARPKASMSPLPPRAFQAPKIGAAERERYEQATHVVMVRAMFPDVHPPLAAIGALALSHGIAAAFEGVALDVEYPRLLPLAALRKPFMPDGFSVSEHIVCPHSTSRSGVWLTTHGLGRFGLPNLEMVDIPGDGESLTPLLMGVAQALLRRIGDRHDDEQRGPTANGAILELDAEFELAAEDVAAALGKETALAGTCRVRLTAMPEKPGLIGRLFGAKKEAIAKRNSLVRVGPPADYRGELGEWYFEAVRSLTGAEPDRAPLATPSSDAAMAAARDRARSEWPDVKSRFSKGLPQGSRLYAKHGFEVEGGSEYMWVAVSSIEQGKVHGTLANDSQHARELKSGRRVSFVEDDLYDWMITGEGGYEGGYTNAALRAD